ncbi:MAG: RDD family protein [Terracidiphilus sp.]
MNVKHFRWLFIAVIVALLFPTNNMDKTIGMSENCINGDCHVAGGTEPHAIFYAVGIIILYAIFLRASLVNIGTPMTGIFRRFLAFWIDLFLFMMATAPIIGIVPCLMEWRRTGIFEWNFARDFSFPSDGWLSFILVLLTFVCMAFYFAIPLILRRPTPGACIMGYQIVTDDSVGLPLKKALQRSYYGFIAVCTPFRVLFKPQDKEHGKFWLDEKFGTHAIRLK